MKIYSMTATFGKLEHQTLTLNPGLNVISAGNEWGKSTWCAFLAVMLYGLDTRAKSTRNALADKERFAPWSGAPMSGRIALNWGGRDITIERSTKGRIPLGEFQAYETGSGMAVPELNSRNCGEMLLGVERSVFLRSGFIRFSDLNITDDEALRRRLNNLVTTGDENSAADGLGDQLRNLKNKIRHNRTGLLPQAEAEKKRLEAALQEMQRLEERNDEILRQMDELEDWRRALENHRDALAYSDSLEDARKVSAVEHISRECRDRYENLQAICATLADRERVRGQLDALRQLADRRLELHRQLRELPVPEKMPGAFENLSAEEARDRARMDVQRHGRISGGWNFWYLPAVLLTLAGLIWLFFRPIPGLICCAGGAVCGVCGLLVKIRRGRELAALGDRYETEDSNLWLVLAENYAGALERRGELTRQMEELRSEIREFTDNQGLELCRRDWEGILAAWEARDEALRELESARDHHRDLKAMARQAKAPEFPDRLTHSEAYTARLLEEAVGNRQRLENLQGQCRGSMEALGSKRELLDQLEAVNRRIRQLETTFAALMLAQETLTEASAQLQRRFAPRIARRAGALMMRMTDGRYDRLTIGDDLSLRAGARQEDVLRGALWRSDGTVDQLYLALRLAVAEELLPGGPLVLDDALVRFDDKRLEAAMEILKDEAKDRQVILFTCHDRESRML